MKEPPIAANGAGSAYPIRGSFLRYCAAAAASFVVNLSLTWGLHTFVETSTELAFAAALVVAILMNFVLARHFIYRVSAGSVSAQFFKYLLTTASFRAIEYGAFLLLHTIIGVMYLLAAGAVLLASFVVKFFFYGSKVFVVR